MMACVLIWCSLSGKARGMLVPSIWPGEFPSDDSSDQGSWDFLKAMTLTPQYEDNTSSPMNSSNMEPLANRMAHSLSPRLSKVAILTSGTLQRYFLGHATQGLIGPLVKQGHAVDYYLTLNSGDFTSWNSGADGFVAELHGSLPAIEQLIRDRVSHTGCVIRHLEISQGVALDKVDKSVIKTHKKFPGIDNLLSKNKKLEELWGKLEEVEKKSGRYTTVIFLADDSIWFKPFDLNRLRQSSDLAPQGFALDCSAQMHGKARCTVWPPAFTDYIFVVDREVAGPFGKQYSLLLNVSELYPRARDDEHFVGQLINGHGIKMNRSPADLIPMQRGGHQRVDGKSGQIEICLHKLCDGTWTHDGVNYPYLRPLRSMPPCETMRGSVPGAY